MAAKYFWGFLSYMLTSSVKSIYSVVILTSLFLLQACGGGGSKPADNVQQEYKFSLQGQLLNNCGLTNQFSDYDFYLQDENWQTIKKYQPNAQGVVNLIITKENINYTIVAKTRSGDAPEGYDIVSYQNVKTATQAVYFAQYDNKVNNNACQCVKQDLQLRHRPFASREQVLSSANFASWQAIDERTTEFTDVEVCRDKSSAWPKHSFAVLGKNSQDEVIGATEFVDDFSSANNGFWQATAVDVAEYELTLAKNHQMVTTSQLISGRHHFAFNVPSSQREVYLFKSHPYISEAVFVSEASHQFVDVTSLLGTFKLQRQRRITSEIAEQSLDVQASKELPDIDQQYLSELSADGSYDFSQVKGHPMLIAEFDYLTLLNNVSIPVKWTYYGPAKGTLPIVKPPADHQAIIGDKNNIYKTKITLLKSNATNKYQEYIAYAQSADPREFSDDIERIVLEVN